MTNDDLQQLKAGALAVKDRGVIQSINLPASAILAMIERIEAGAAQQPAGYIDRKDLVRLLNCRAELWASPYGLDAVSVFLAPVAEPIELAAARNDAQRHERLFLAACGDLGLVSEALGLDPDDGGAEPIITAIKALQAGVPAGWKAVPVDPTEGMVIDGFESAPDRMFDGPDYPEEYDAMSGCQQAAFRAKRCWAAMLEAAPAAGSAS